MKAKIILAFFLFVIGLGIVTDWILFSIKKENEILSWPVFKLKYIHRFPEFLRSLIQNSLLFTLLCMGCFIVSGLIFIKNKQKVFLALGILSFVLAFWQLFSLM
jgi:small-conductance mechanosensitive channel